MTDDSGGQAEDQGAADDHEVNIVTVEAFEFVEHHQVPIGQSLLRRPQPAGKWSYWMTMCMFVVKRTAPGEGIYLGWGADHSTTNASTGRIDTIHRQVQIDPSAVHNAAAKMDAINREQSHSDESLRAPSAGQKINHQYLVESLNEAYSSEHEKLNLAYGVRGQIASLVTTLLWTLITSWLHIPWYVWLIGIFVTLPIGFFAIILLAHNFTRISDLHIVVHLAENIVRLNIIEAGAASGTPLWEIDRDGPPKVVARDGPLWDEYWPRVHSLAVALGAVHFRQRNLVYKAAYKRAAKAIASAEALASQHGAELPFWL